MVCITELGVTEARIHRNILDNGKIDTADFLPPDLVPSRNATTSPTHGLNVSFDGNEQAILSDTRFSPAVVRHSIDQGLLRPGDMGLPPFGLPPPRRRVSISDFVSLKSVASLVASGSVTLEAAAVAAKYSESGVSVDPGQLLHPCESHRLALKSSFGRNGGTMTVSPAAARGTAAAAPCSSSLLSQQGPSSLITRLAQQQRPLRKGASSYPNLMHAAAGGGLPSPRASCHGSVAESEDHLIVSIRGGVSRILSDSVEEEWESSAAALFSPCRMPLPQVEASHLKRDASKPSDLPMLPQSGCKYSRLSMPAGKDSQPDGGSAPSDQTQAVSFRRQGSNRGWHGHCSNGDRSSRVPRTETDLDRICRAAHVVVCDSGGGKTLGEAISEIKMMNKAWRHQS